MTLEDCNGVTKVYEGEPGWWHEVDMCREVTQKRLEHGWYITVAERSGCIDGHAEWIVDRDKNGEYLYLDELQVIKSQQQSGIGRAIVADGVNYAQKRGISRIMTIPEQDTGSEVFYAKCGFVKVGETLFTALETDVGAGNSGFMAVDRVPKSVLDTRILLFGLAVASPLHMWVIENDKISYDKYKSDAFKLENGDYIQFRHKPDDKRAIVLLWSSEPMSDSIADILRCAAYAGLETVEFEFLAEHTFLFDKYGAKIEPSETIMELTVEGK
jgi:GNAT superfamily N-acetyltransferase